jgi:hypothetical protein
MDYEEFLTFMNFEVLTEQKGVGIDQDAQGKPLRRIHQATVKNVYCIGDLLYKTLGDGSNEMVSATLKFHG